MVTPRTTRLPGFASDLTAVFIGIFCSTSLAFLSSHTPRTKDGEFRRPRSTPSRHVFWMG
jgi:hypothetical protein